MEQPEPGEEAAYRQLQREAERIASLIVASDYAAIDVVIEVRKLKQYADARFPGRSGLFEMVYGSRFRRLWAQFRQQQEGPLPQW